MPLSIPVFLLVLFILITLGSALWLLINARAVSRVFGGNTELEPGPGPRGPSRSTVIAMLVAFNIGWIACIAIWTFAIINDDTELIEAEV